MVHTHKNSLAFAKRLIALVLVMSMGVNTIGEATAITYDAATSTYFDSIDDFGLATASDSIGLQFGGTLGQYLRYNRAIGRFVFTDDLDVQGTISGARLTIMGNASISGALTIEGGTAALSGSVLRGFGLNVDCDTAGTSKLLWDTTTGRFSCGTDTDTNTAYTAGQGLNLSTTSFRLNTTVTGAVIQAANSLASSGSLTWKGTGSSGSSLNIGGGTIQIAANGSAVFNENSQDRDYRFEGDTDQNLIFLDASTDRMGIGTATPKAKLDVLGTISGTSLQINGAGVFLGNVTAATNNSFDLGSSSTRWANVWANSANISASLSVATTSLLSGNVGIGAGNTTTKAVLNVSGVASGVTLYATKSFSGAGLTDCQNATTSKLLWNATTGRFSCGTDQGSAYTAGQGLTLTSTSFKVNSTLTGSLVNFQTVSGSAVNGRNYFTGSGSMTIADVNPTLKATLSTTAANDIIIAGRYAYVADGSAGLRVIDITNPAVPVIVSTLATTSATGIAAAGRYVYIADGTSGLRVIDVSTPTAPKLLGTIDTSGTATNVVVAGPYAYVADLASGLQIIDVSNPGAPFIAGTLDTTAAYGVAVSGRYAYIGDDSGGLRVIDVSNPYIPRLVSSLGSQGIGITVVGRYVYLAANSSGLQIIDVSNPASPSVTGTYAGSQFYDVTVAGRYAYVSRFALGLSVVDVSVPASPVLVNTYDTAGTAYDAAVAGRYAYVTDDSSGIAVIDIGGIDAPGATLGTVDATLLNVQSDARVFGNMIVDRALSVAANMGVWGQTTMHTWSGAALTLTQSGSKVPVLLQARGTISGAVLYASRGFSGAGLSDCDTAGTSKLLWDATTSRFSCGTDQSGGSLTAGQGLSLNGTVLSLSSSISGTLLEFQTNSGAVVYAERQLSTSGSTTLGEDSTDTLMVWSSATFDAQTTFNKNVSIGDSDTRSFNVSSNVTFNPAGGANAFFNVRGDTNTNLIYANASTDKVGIGTNNPDTILDVIGVLSGITVYATQSFSGAGLTTCSNATTSKLLWNSTTGRFSCGTDQGSTYTAGQGLNLSTTSFRLNTTVTGAVIQAANSLASSGSLTWKGTGSSGSSLNIGGGTIQIAANGSAVFNENSQDRDYRFEGDTDQNLIFLDASTDRMGIGTATPKAKLDVLGTISGTSLQINGAGVFLGNVTAATNNSFDLGSSSLRWANGWFNNANLSANISVLGTSSLTGNVGVGSANSTTKAVLNVSGVMSGITVYATKSFSGAGLTDCDTAGTSKLMWDATTGRFSCGTDQTGGTSGGSYFAGQGLSLNGANSFSLNSTVTGATVAARNTLASSGVIIVENTDIGTTAEMIIADSASSEASQVFLNATAGHDKDNDGLYIGNYHGPAFMVNREASGLNFGTSNLARMNINSVGNVGIGMTTDFIGDATVKAKLEVAGVMSGITVYATQSFSGAGLSSCSNGTTDKLLWNATTGRFSCGTDQSGGSSGGGMAYATASGIFLKRSGGTMTGTLNIQSGNSATPTTASLLNVRGTMSGRGLSVTGTGAFQAPLIATNLSFGTILMGTGAMRATGSGKITPQLFVAGRQPVLVGSGKTATVPRGLAVQGNYAYVATQGSIQTFDISVPTNPKIVSTPASSTAFSVFPAGKYLVSANAGGVGIFDLTNPGSPSSLATYTTSCTGGAGPKDAAVQGRFMYVACNGDNTFQVVDIADPSSPTLVASTTSTGIYRIKIEGDYAYVVETGGTFRIIDISEPTRPTSVGSVSVGTTPQGLYVQGRYAYVANYGSSNVTIIDISSPTSPAVTSTFSTGASSGPQEVYVQGRTMYVTNFDGNNFMTVDVSNPNAPVTTATYSVPTGTNPYGLWVQGRYAYVGLRSKSHFNVFDLGGTYDQQLEAGGAEVGSLNVRRSFDAVDGTFRGSLIAQSAFFQGSVAIKASSGAFALRVQDGGIRMNGGVFSVLPGTSPRTMSGIDLNANVNNVAVAGNYLYTVSDSVTGNEFRIIDIANPDKPVIVGGLETGQNTKALFVSTRNAFIGMNGTGAGSGMYILDITNPGSPTISSRLNFQTAVNSLYVSGKFIYAGLDAMSTGRCDAKYQLFNGCDFAVVDFSNPNLPKVVGGLQLGTNVNQVYVQNRYAYLALSSVSGNDFRIVDLANTQTPQVVGGIDFSNNVRSVFASGRYAFVGLDSDAGAEFRVIDVTNKTSPSSVGGLDTNIPVSSIVVNGDWARLGLAFGGTYNFQTVDLRNPLSPASFGGIGYGVAVNSVAVAGKYAYLGRNTSAGNDMVIVDLAGIDSPTASIGSLFAANLAVSDNVRFDNNAYIRNALNVGRGGIISKGSLSVQTTGTGSAKGGTGTLVNAFEVRNGTGQHLFSVSENGTVQGGIPSFATGTTMLAYNMMSRRSGYCTPLITSATTFTSVGMSTCTVNGTATAWPAGGRMKLKIAAANTANAMGGITTVFTETRPQFRPKTMFDVTTGTGTTGLRFWGGIVESSTASLAPTVTSAATTIDYAALAWEDGISGTQWLCCSGDGTNHSCQSMGVPVQTNTEYMGQVDWSQPGKVTCQLQVRDKTYRLTKTNNISVNNVSLGENVVLVNKSIAGATARVMYTSRLVLEQN